MTLPIDFEANPLVPVVIQDDESRDVLMVGFMNQLAFERTLETGFVHFWSRSRNRLWKKGETSGHTQEVISIGVNCEDNSLLIQVIQRGAVCHTGHRTCYYRQVLPDGTLFETSDRIFDPATVYQEPESTIECVWYGAYEFLRDFDLSEFSQTSRRFHTQGPAPIDRVADELVELAGVLSGEHAHTDFESDLLLEGSQILYWVAVCSVSRRLHPNRDLQISTALRPQPSGEVEEWIISSLYELAETLRGESNLNWAHALRCVVQIAGDAIARAGYDPLALIERDLAELRSKPYLAPYFSSVEA